MGGAKTVLYRGTVTLQQLAKVSETARLLANATDGKKPVPVSWRLWVGRDQLPRRFTTSFVLLSSPKSGDLVVSSDTRLTGWGTRTPVKAPPAAQVIGIEDLGSGEDLAQELAIQALVPFGDPYEGLIPEK